MCEQSEHLLKQVISLITFRALCIIFSQEYAFVRFVFLEMIETKKESLIKMNWIESLLIIASSKLYNESL